MLMPDKGCIDDRRVCANRSVKLGLASVRWHQRGMTANEQQFSLFDLELEFRRICDGENKFGAPLPFEIVFADKKANSSGLQLADLVARPIGMSVLRPDRENRAFEMLTRKFYCDGGRENVGTGYENWGLKIFPPQISEKPR